MEPSGEWTPGRIEDRFRAFEREINGLEHDVRVIMPLVGQVGGVEATVASLDERIDDLRTDLKHARTEFLEGIRDARVKADAAKDKADGVAIDVIRTGRAEQVKLIGILLGSAVSILGILAGLFKAGVIG